MPVSTRNIKRRIKSVKNTRKITKAMELVAASKMRKAVNSVLATRPYAKMAWETVSAISGVTDTSFHPLLRRPSAIATDGLQARPEKTGKVLFMLVTSDRGLAGGFNSNMVKRTLAAMRELTEWEIEVVTVGQRAADAMRRAGKNIAASFTGLANNPRFADVLPVGRLAISEFTSGRYQRVVLAYTDFISAVTQRPNIVELLPLGVPETDETGGQKRPVGEFLFEPNPISVLDRLLPRLVETMVYQAVLESAASEHSARMMSMRSASDAADEMVDALTFTFNQARQAGITKEIAEISSGKAALENL